MPENGAYGKLARYFRARRRRLMIAESEARGLGMDTLRVACPICPATIGETCADDRVHVARLRRWEAWRHAR